MRKIAYLLLSFILFFGLFSSCQEKDKTNTFFHTVKEKVKGEFSAIGKMITNGFGEKAGKTAASQKMNKIPIAPERWYQLNNTRDDLSALFDGETKEKVKIKGGKVLQNFDAYYPLSEGEEMLIEGIKFYDWQGIFKDTPMTLFAITNQWERIPIATFTGEQYDTWVGPNPQDPGSFKLKEPVKDIRYLVINSWSDYPSEIELYGSYKKGKALSVTNTKRKIKLKNTFGVNAFEWDVVDGGRGSVINERKVEALKSFTAIRHYMDWERLETQEGVYAFNPTVSGGWDYDLIYKRLKAEGIEVLACLKTIPEWMSITYPEGERDAENVPLKFGKDLSAPDSYIEQAKVAFQYAARYGSNKNVDSSLLKNVLSGKVYPGAKDSPVRTREVGLDLIRYIECDNERDKWWKGRKAYQTAREYAANLSAFYDGHKNTMGPGVGVKNADPNMKVVIGGLTGPDTDYLKGLVDWCKEFRGYRPDGSVDLCWDIVNYHHYSSNGQDAQGAKANRGVAPELSHAIEGAEKMLRVVQQYSPDMPVWISELGFDKHQESPLKAIPIKGKSALETQADWILRSSLLYARLGVERVFFYQLYDDNPSGTTKFATMGLVNKADKSPNPAADYLRQANRLLGEYTYQETLHDDPIVDRYELNGQSAYVLLVPDEKGRKVDYTLDLGTAGSASIYYPKTGKSFMDVEERSTQEGKLKMQITETPSFVIPATER
jgi:endoglucanase